ncbi:MAG: hypothetical protein GY862_08120 [Gammaproteobacteria bacterium]|nr:hypothetical protein [Gammaproteobacteria bacterium]
MESAIIYATLLYLMGFRLLVILLGGMSIYLGYRLFVQAMGKRQSKAADSTGAEMDARFGDNHLSLKNAAPGTFFAAFGVVIVIVVLVGSPPAFKYKTGGVSLETEGGDVQLAKPETKKPAAPTPEKKPAIATECILRADEVPDTADAAHKSAGKYFQRLLQLEKQAVALDDQNPEYLDSLAGLYFLAGKFDLALQHQEKAAEQASKREDLQKRLAAYQHIGRIQ